MRFALVVGALVSAMWAFSAPDVEAREGRPAIDRIRCWPVEACGGNDGEAAMPGGTVLVVGSGFPRRASVSVPTRRLSASGQVFRRQAAVLRTARRLVVRLPEDAVSGPVLVGRLSGRGAVSRTVHVDVERSRPVAGSRKIPALPDPQVPFEGRGMWIWEMDRTEGGDIDEIAAKARARSIDTVFVKSADGARVWSQFSPQLVDRLRDAGLRVCAWQFVYGDDPLGEADAAAQSIRRGAECFVIDAESDYEGRYYAAQRYIETLRSRVGRSFPIGLTGFPYVDYHSTFPYSVFLGPGAASFNLPQMYWKSIGTTVDEVFAHTWRENRPYGRPIFPIGQLHAAPRTDEIADFNRRSDEYGAKGLSWWDWQEASPAEWGAVGADSTGVDRIGVSREWTALGPGSRGDQVVWAQQHLAAVAKGVRIDGDFGTRTERAVRAFQLRRDLRPTGTIDRSTWRALLSVEPVVPRWKPGGGPRFAGVRQAATLVEGPDLGIGAAQELTGPTEPGTSRTGSFVVP